MQAKKTLFDIRVRTIECAYCGAPVDSPLVGGEVCCRYCSKTNVVGARVTRGQAQSTPTPESEAIRYGRLFEQAQQPSHGHEYDLWVAPPGFARVAAAIARSDGATVLKAWREQKSSPTAAGAPRRLCYLAIALSRLYERDKDLARARAVLETSLDYLKDEGHRDLVRCRLATIAAHVGEVEDAEQWLAECDPAPAILEIDGEKRYADACIAVAKMDYRRALRATGEWIGQWPTDVHHEPYLTSLRIVAAERIYGRAYCEQHAHRLGPTTPALGPVHRFATDQGLVGVQAHPAASWQMSNTAAPRLRLPRPIAIVAVLGFTALMVFNALTHDRGGWDGSKTWRCKSGKHEISGVEADLEDTAIYIHNGCEVILEDVDIRSQRGAIMMYDEGRLTLRSGSLKAEHGSAIAAWQNATIRIEGGHVEGTKAIQHYGDGSVFVDPDATIIGEVAD